MFDVFKKCFGCSKQTLGAAFDNKLFWASLKISNYELIGHQTPKKATGPRNFCYMCTLFLSLNFKCKLKGVTILGHSKGLNAFQLSLPLLLTLCFMQRSISQRLIQKLSLHPWDFWCQNTQCGTFNIGILNFVRPSQSSK